MDKKRPLSGERVLDLTDEKGMFCARLLADMGAEVIRIGKPGIADLFSWENLGKLSITLNIERAEGQEIFKRLIKTADILIESFPPGYLQKLGFAYASLKQSHPRLIMASITSFGQEGPYSQYKATDIVTAAMGGQAYVAGEPDMPPLKLYGNQTCYTACLYAAIGIMLAIAARHTTGRGQYLDISILECAVSSLDHVLVRYLYQGVVAERNGSLHWNGSFRVFPCKDGYALVSLFWQWETLVEWLDSEGMAEDLTDKKYLNNETRLRNINHIIEVLARWTRKHDVAELVETGQLMHFPWASVASIQELLDNPQLNELGFFIEAEHPKTGQKYKTPGTPVRTNGSVWQIGKQLSIVGQDNNKIYSELGFSDNEIEALKQKGVI